LSLSWGKFWTKGTKLLRLVFTRNAQVDLEVIVIHIAVNIILTIIVEEVVSFGLLFLIFLRSPFINSDKNNKAKRGRDASFFG
jgi:hypothetical protein